jgi:hypothetical protein
VVRIEDVVFLDIEELEELSLRLLRGESWTTILGQKRLCNHPDISMHNFLCLTNRARERHPFVARSIEEAAQMFEGRTTDK